MKKDLLIHFFFLISFLLLTSVFKGLFRLSTWPFWLGGLLGTILPDIDHFIYIYYLRPQELASQRVMRMLNKKEFLSALNFLFEARSERTKLIFHTAYFQLLLLAITLYVVTSSTNLFGKGLVLAFTLHLLVDQLIDLVETGTLNNWFTTFFFLLDLNKMKIYWGVNVIIFLVFAILF